MNATQQSIANRIYAAAIAGNDVNQGLPDSLAKLLVGQSGNETNEWTSHFFVEGNACFGYSCDPNSKWQIGCSTSVSDNGVGVGYYTDVEDSTQELVDWIYRRQKEGKFPSDLSTITTPEQYADLLKKCGYYTSASSSYASRITDILKSIGSLFHKR